MRSTKGTWKRLQMMIRLLTKGVTQARIFGYMALPLVSLMRCGSADWIDIWVIVYGIDRVLALNECRITSKMCFCVVRRSPIPFKDGYVCRNLS